MLRPSKDLVVATGLLVTLSLITLLASQKFLHLTLGRTVYYCQAVIRSLSLQLPAQLGVLLIGTLSMIVILSGAKFILTYIRILNLRKNLFSISTSPNISQVLLNRLRLINKVFLIPDKRPFAFCFGIRDPKIYLSTAIVQKMSGKELEAILLHEKSHLENRDSLTLLLVSVTQSFFPFFPLVSDLVRNLRIARELKADETVVTTLGESRTLLSVLRKLLIIKGTKTLAFAPAVSDLDTIELRITALVKHKPVYKKFGLLNVLTSLVSLIAIGGLTLAPVQAIENHEQDQDVMMICPQDSSCAAWCKQNNTVVPYSEVVNSSRPYTNIDPR